MLAHKAVNYIRLNLGCGKKHWEGYVNVDLPGRGGELACDIRKLPYGEQEIGEVHAIHVLEHFRREEVPALLKEWHRVLQPDGKLVLELPSRDKVFFWIRQMPEPPEQMTLWAMYGDPTTIEGEPDMHKWLWGEQELKTAVAVAGFRDVQAVEPKFHVKRRDMRIEARK